MSLGSSKNKGKEKLEIMVSVYSRHFRLTKIWIAKSKGKPWVYMNNWKFCLRKNLAIYFNVINSRMFTY